MNFYSKNVLSFILILLIYNFSFGQEKSNFIKLDQSFIGNSNMVEDHLGYMWILDNEGLNKYNGYDFSHTPYTQIFGKNFTRDRDYLLGKDNQGNIWLSSYNGELTRFNLDGTHATFKENLTYDKSPLQITSLKAKDKDMWMGSTNGILFKHDFNTSKIDSITVLPKLDDISQTISGIAVTRDNKIWMSTLNGKIYNYSLTTHELKSFKNHLFPIKQNIKLTNDKEGNLWVATELQGLFCFNTTKENEFKQYDKIETSDFTVKHHMFISIFYDSSGIIWAGTDGDGLYSINPENDEVYIYKHEEPNKLSISNNTITDIAEDSKGNLWVTTKKGIINILPKSDSNIRYYNGLENNTPTLALSVLKSSEGSLWVGTDGKGLNRVFSDNSKLQYNNSKKDKYFFTGKYIQDLIEDVYGNIWIATYQNGLWVYDIRLKTFSKIETKDLFGNESPDIRTLFKDSKNRIWVTSGTAIYVFSKDKELLATFKYNSNGLFGSISMGVCEDEFGLIWVGVNPGRLFKFNENSNDIKSSYFTKHNYYIKKHGDSRNYNIHSITPDNNGNLWILCASGFVIKYNIKNDSYQSFIDKDYFKNISISSILIENPTNIWFGSSNGIHHYNSISDILIPYYQIDGFQNIRFIRRSSFKDGDGKFYFGGELGVDSFYPSEMVKKESFAKLYINNIEVLNKPAHLIVSDQVDRGIENVKNLKLNSDQSSFSFQFSAIDNLLNTNYHYAYKLKGFDKDWIVPKKDRIASYTNIPFGNYTFEVKAGSKRGVWDIEPRKVEISIKAPMWLSTWAIAIYIVLALFLGYGFFVWIRLKSRLVKEALQNKQDKELYALKMNFFAKMSHEIQTPLTLIMGPIDDMLNRAGSKGNQLLMQRLQIINNNAKRLSRIATELMTVRNKELGKLRIFASKNNITKHLKGIALSFSEQARFKNIDLIQEYPEKDIEIWYDADKIEHIVYNLLSNAFKFTPKEGRITLKIINIANEDSVELSIKDSGPGIPKDELEDIFKLFYQADLGKHKKGFGIGLALTKELILLHKGTINVVSSPESGTTFTVKLSTNETVFSEDEKIALDPSKLLKQSLVQSTNGLGNEFSLKAKSSSKKINTLLIVEDNIEMQMFLRDVLSKTYNVLIAENGALGIKLAEQNDPDLILSDILMPVMDGIEMCRVLQKNRKTSHIPIVLLTAKNTTKSKLKGLKSGAIEYLQKPFNFHELLLKINNIIDAKNKVLSKYKTEIASSPKESLEKSKDDLFLERLVKVLNEQINNSDFRLEELAEILNMSYSVIYRRCQEITGMTLVELIRSIKLKKAALLILEQGYNISEAAFMVGYKDSKYFTKCFKEEFGKTPNYFKQEVKKNGLDDFLKNYNLKYVEKD